MKVDFKWLMPTPPPADSTDKDAAYWWNFSVFIHLSIIGGVTFMNILLTWGLLPLIFGGFATTQGLGKTNDAITTLQRGVDEARKEAQDSKNEIKATIIGQNLYNLRIMQCQYLRAHNGPAVESMENQIKMKMQEFFAATGYQYVTSSCENLGIMP